LPEAVPGKSTQIRIRTASGGRSNSSAFHDAVETKPAQQNSSTGGKPAQLTLPAFPKSLKKPIAATYAEAIVKLNPLVRIGARRPVLFAGDALPM